VNRWKIPAELELCIIERDPQCVYCAVSFALLTPRRGQRPSWEHIVNDARIVTKENIARCCMSCNASKGAKSLNSWLASNYCQLKGIHEGSVSPVVRDALKELPTLQKTL
jgi:hypothetical protein